MEIDTLEKVVEVYQGNLGEEKEDDRNGDQDRYEEPFQFILLRMG